MHFFDFRDNSNDMEESIILFTQIKLKSKSQKKVIYVMAALLGALVGSELEKAISVLPPHPGGAARAGASCTAQQ